MNLGVGDKVLVHTNYFYRYPIGKVVYLDEYKSICKVVASDAISGKIYCEILKLHTDIEED